MFKSALSSIELLAKRTAQTHTTQPIPPRKAKGKEYRTALGESSPAYAISHLLNSFLGFLDKADELHQKIFDAFLFVLFDRVGRRLYYCTFGRSRSSSIQDSIMPVQPSQDTNKATEHNLEAFSIKLEVKALVLILERAMGLAPNHMNPSNWSDEKRCDPSQPHIKLQESAYRIKSSTESSCKRSPPAYLGRLHVWGCRKRK